LDFFAKLFLGMGNAFEALRANKVRTALTVLGVLIGVMSIIMLVSIGQGVKEQVSDEIKGLGANLFFISPNMGGGKSHTPPGMMSNKMTYNDVIAIQTKNGIGIEVVPVLRTSAVVKYSNTTYMTAIFGTTEKYAEALSQKVTDGKFFNENMVSNRRRVCVIGKTIVEELFANKDPIGKDIAISGGKFKIIGILESKGATMGQNQDDQIVIPITAAQALLGTTKVNFIVCKAPSEDRIEESKRIVRRILLRRLTENDFDITDQKDVLETLKKITGILTVALGGIAGISLLVGGIGIMNIMLVTVAERTREIGIRKAIGAKESDILTQFLIESILISATGGIIGILIGWSGSLALRRWVATAVTPWSVLLAFGFALFIGIFFGVYPASKAAKLDPIEALRHE